MAVKLTLLLLSLCLLFISCACYSSYTKTHNAVEISSSTCGVNTGDESLRQSLIEIQQRLSVQCSLPATKNSFNLCINQPGDIFSHYTNNHYVAIEYNYLYI